MTDLEQLALRIVNALSTSVPNGEPNKDRATIEGDEVRLRLEQPQWGWSLARKVAQTRFVQRLLERWQAELLLHRHKEESDRIGYLEREVLRLGDALLNAGVENHAYREALEWYLREDQADIAANVTGATERPAARVLGVAVPGEGA